MFGYIKVDRAELLGKEYDAYKGVYCSLCKQLGRDYSIFARFILSYDCTFYAVLALDICESPPCYKQGRCRFNPFKKCAYAQTQSLALSLAAALSVISAYYKLKDDLLDSPWYKRIFLRLAQPFFSRWRKKAAKNYPRIDEIVSEMLSSQIKAERDPACVLDQACEPTANMLKSMCELSTEMIPLRQPLDRERTARILGAFGYYLGRWIYLIDAADDYEKDKKHGNFNPFLLNEALDMKELTDRMKASLNHALSEALLSYSLLDKGRFDPLIMNVLQYSCVITQDQIINKPDHNDQN